MAADLHECDPDLGPELAAVCPPLDAAAWLLLAAEPTSPPQAADVLGLTAWAEALSTVDPGPGLATLLDTMPPDSLTDDEVVEMVAAGRRLAAWAQARTAAWAATLADRASMRPTGSPSPRAEDGNLAADELAMRLAESRRSTAALVGDGVAYRGLFAPTGEALAAGLIDARRARLLLDRLRDQAAETVWQVQERLLPDAGRRTVTQLRRDVDAALIELDGVEAAVRHRAARHTRRVTHPVPLPDGMAALWWVLPAADAARIDGLLDTAARAARSAGDPRTLDQLRSDGLRDLVLDVPDWAARASGTCARPHGVTTVHVTVPLTTLLGRDDQAGDLHGLGPVDADQARALAFDPESTWRRLVTDPLTNAVLDVGRARYRPPAPLAEHVRARDRRCARPGCDVAAERCDLDHTIEFTGRPATPPGVAPPGPGHTAADNLGPLCRHDHRLKSGAGFVLRQPAPGVFEWLTPAGYRYRLRPGADRAPERITAGGRAVGHRRGGARPGVDPPTSQSDLDARDGPPPF